MSTLITTAEAARILGKSVATINRMAANGDLRTEAKLDGIRGANLFDRAEIERYAADRASTETAAS